METRKETLSNLKLCRFCLSQDETLTSLYDRSRAPKNSVPLALKILSCVSIEVFPSDKMPSYICNRCKFFMDISYEFKQMCRLADENVLQFIQNGNDLKSPAWPPTLLKLFRVTSKAAPELAVMKTVVEGGATIHVTAQDRESESEEDDDENVYNVKIGEGSEDGPKNARVKVITASKQIKGKPKQGKDLEEEDIPISGDQPSTSVEGQAQSDMTEEGWEKSNSQEGCWPCDECDCTYPLQQLLKLHKTHKHRARNVQCEQCNAKFFNNYHLTVHQLRHATDDMVFTCTACGKSFKRHILLKRHEKLVHADLAQLACPSCPATFLSQDELEMHHDEKHVSTKEKRFVCDVCNKRFHEKSTLQRHKENLHDKSADFACIYCPSRDRSYPCKYCNKSFIKSHHYTRHLRLKHREANRTCRGPFGESTDQYRCEQCEDSFSTQDELIFHSAIHATQNLTCPLCQEKFEDVDAVTTHVRTHVHGSEFMCELCELIFTTKDKLDSHMINAHDDELSRTDELGQDESSMDEEDDDTGINVTEENGQMVVEIKKADDFMLTNSQDEAEDKHDNTNSEESETDMTYTELSTVDTLSIVKKDAKAEEKPVPTTIAETTVTKIPAAPVKTVEKTDGQTPPILRKAEEIKRKAQPTPEPAPEKKINKAESNNTGASDKSLRLLEKELQELKRTNTRTDAVKTPAKSVELLRNRRPQLHTSTPKLRPAVEEKKAQLPSKSPALDKKQPERRVITKENKEPKETKGNNGNGKEDKEVKEKETPKSVVKNGASEKTTPDEGIRRSTRPSKIKDYAKMIRDRTQESDEDEDSDEIDEEYRESERSIEAKTKARRASVKPSPKPAATPTSAPRKRGRPRKDTGAAVATLVLFLYIHLLLHKVNKLQKYFPIRPAKIKKDDNDGEESKANEDESEMEKPKETAPAEPEKPKEKTVPAETATTEPKPVIETKSPGLLVSPTGQTLKKIPIKALPPGVKPLPLPVSARPVGGGEVCEMQIGKKVVKVQKIVMTKAEVEAMAKKGLVEMKDGTMVLKQGIKIPTSDPTALKNLVGDEAAKESPSKNKATPTRCNIDDDA
ncbi:uncharacterized protein LOC142980878 isoform X2 [Anticarsia gemmatalis]|uniref:uncharacterized protein LOC142980878 isoform X2 n=1 Tax=Anticarsia gemmatalis TaxID=129554 RepID=UPI003F75C8F2